MAEHPLAEKVALALYHMDYSRSRYDSPPDAGGKLYIARAKAAILAVDEWLTMDMNVTDVAGFLQEPFRRETE